MITFTPPAENLSGVIGVILASAANPVAIIVGVLVGFLARRWPDVFWAVPILLAAAFLLDPALAAQVQANPLVLAIGLGAAAWAAGIFLVRTLAFRARAAD